MTNILANPIALANYKADAAHTVTREQLIKAGQVGEPGETYVGTDEARAKYEAEALAVSKMKSDDAPENVWGKIVIGGNVVAEIYKNGAFAHFGGAKLDIDNTKPLKDIAHQLIQQVGGYLQPGPAYGSENKDMSGAFSDATRQFKAKIAEYMQSGSALNKITG